MANTQNTQITAEREAALDIALEYLGAQAEGATIIRDAESTDTAFILTEAALYTVRAYSRSHTAEITRALFVGGYDHLALAYPAPEAPAPRTETIYFTREARDAAVAAKASVQTPAKSPCYCDYTFHKDGC